MQSLAAGLTAGVIWGVAPLFFVLLNHVPPEELLAHRILWGLVTVLAFCLLTGRTGRIRAALADPRERVVLAVSAVLVGTNWLIFLFAVQFGRVTEVGVGYYIMPLVSVVLGVVVLGERLDRLQWGAVGLAGLAVLVLAFGTGVAPWLPLSLALSFAVYGLLRKRAETGAISGFVVETVFLMPVALVWLGGAHLAGWSGISGLEGGHLGRDAGTTLLLIAAGTVTGVPLILFAVAARGLPYSKAGLLFYLAPSLQVILGSTVLGERLTTAHWIALPMIWVALALYSYSAVQRERASRRLPSAASTVSTTLR